MPTVNEILTYDGEVTDIVINYVMLFVVLVVPAVYALGGGSKRLCWWWVGVFIFLWVYQIVLCLFEGCTGISIVWNSVYGHNVYDALKKAFKPNIKVLLYAEGVAVLAVNVYYAVTADAITTVAHICALLLGILLSAIYWRFCSPPTVKHE